MSYIENARHSLITLPSGAVPTKLRCIQIMVPDGANTDYLQELSGALRVLTLWSNYQRDPTHKAKDVAYIWRQALLYGITDCETGETITIDESEYDMSLCEQLRYQDGKLQALCCGVWTNIDGQADNGVVPGPVRQPTGEPRPGPGTSGCFEVVLNANNIWDLPFPVQPGDVVTITNIVGTWGDGTVARYKADGHTAVFGNSTGVGQHHDGGDPDGVEYHMQLIAQVGGAFFPCDAPFTVAGTGSQQLSLQANDGTIADNTGSLSFKICVESGSTPPTATWCYTYDFRASDYGWMPYNSGGDRAIYTPGLGFGTNIATLPAVVQIQSSAIASTNITSVELLLSQVLSGADHQVSINIPDHTASDNTVVNNTDTDIVVVLPGGGIAGTGIFVNIQDDNSSLATPWPGYLEQLTVRGTGTNPFGIDNC